MKCIIVDDEPLAREGIELNIEDIDFLELVGMFSGPVEANNFLKENEVDLMFLDVEMPEMTGLEFLKTLDKQPMTILTTAYSEYALEGYELGVIDYIVKPVKMERFIKAVNKAKDFYDMREKSENTAMAAADDYIFLKADRKYVRVYLNDILYIKGMKDYVMVHTKEGRIMTAMNVKTILKQLNEEIFVRVAKSYVININYIDEASQSHVVINGKEIPIGKTYKDNFIDNYIKNRLLER